MATGRLAAWLDSYGAGLRDGLDLAAGQGYRLVHADAARGELEPRQFPGSARRHLRRYLADLGLQMDGLALEYPGLGLADPVYADQRVEQLKYLLEMCADLRVAQTVVSLCGLADPHAGPLATELLGVVADMADRYGITVALCETDCPAELSGRQVRALGCRHLGIALDTAHLPPETQATSPVADLVRVVYLRDVRHRAGGLEEVPFGHGEVDFPALLAGLEAAHADASLVVRRAPEGGVDGLRQGREYMQSLIGRLGTR
jgi:sugar phosphate isomerase/epimerase